MELWWLWKKEWAQPGWNRVSPKGRSDLDLECITKPVSWQLVAWPYGTILTILGWEYFFAVSDIWFACRFTREDNFHCWVLVSYRGGSLQLIIKNAVWSIRAHACVCANLITLQAHWTSFYIISGPGCSAFRISSWLASGNVEHKTLRSGSDIGKIW